MLEGKELQGQFPGGLGEYSGDLDDKGNIAVDVTAKKEIAPWLKIRGTLGLELDLIGALLAASAKAPSNGFLKSIAEGAARLAGRLPAAP